MDMSLISGMYSAVSGAYSAYSANSLASAQTDNANKIRAGNNTVTGAVNERNASITALQRWRQGVANSRVYEAVASNQEAMAVNFNRVRDQKARTNFSASIRQAEESGRQQAMAAVSGVTGSVVDVIDTTSRMRRGMEQQANVQSENYMLSDFNKAEFAQRWATLDSLDYSAIFDNTQIMDLGSNTAKQTSVLGAALGGKDTLKNLSNGLASFNFNSTSKGGDSLDAFLSLNDNFSSIKV